MGKVGEQIVLGNEIKTFFGYFLGFWRAFADRFVHLTMNLIIKKLY